MSLKKLLIQYLLLFIIIPTIWGDRYVELRKGETLYQLSRKYGVSVEAILRANNITDVRDIPEGMKIRIPGSGDTAPSTSYVVQKGDTLYSLAKRFGTSVDEICRLNRIVDKTKVKVGDKLIIPGRSSAAPSETPQGGEVTWPHPGPRQKLTGILKGVAIRGNPGDFITAIAPGKVIWADPYRGFGKTLFIKSNEGYIYVYAGNEELLVDVGEIIEKNRKIAILGKNSRNEASKAYFFIYKNGKPINPEERPVY